MRAKFRSHRDRANKYGIEFQFTYEEWVGWWETHLGPDWMKYRGRRSCDYVMGRKGDIGPYHPDNVMCITASQNAKMARAGEIQSVDQRLKNSIANRSMRNARAKLTDVQVIEIFNTLAPISVLARRYKVSRPVIKGIKTGKNWSHVTGAR